MLNKNKSIKINYQLDTKENERIRILGKNFIKNNIYKCKIVYDDEEYDLEEYLEDITSDKKNIHT